MKNYTEGSGSYKFLHKDYLGSILAITDESGYAVEQRHYDAWGNFTHLKIAGATVDPNNVGSYEFLLDRGYTSHEHLAEVGLIHMNGRLYDPLLRRFLNADENIQDMFNTQNYNKYGYVLNNPLMYNDPSGEFVFIPALIGMAKFASLFMAGMQFSRVTTGFINGTVSFGAFAKSMVAIAATIAIGEIAPVFKADGFWAVVGNGGISGGALGGINSLINDKNFLEGVLRGAVIGAAVGGISYTVNYYVKGYHKPQYTTTDDISVGNNDIIIADQEIMQENIKNVRGNGNFKNIEKLKIEYEGLGVSGDNGLMMGDGKYDVLGMTRKNYLTGKSQIFYSTRAASNPLILSRVMAHESSHTYIYALGLPANLKLSNSPISGLDTIEHLAIRNLESNMFSKYNIVDYQDKLFNRVYIDYTIKLLHGYDKILFENYTNLFQEFFNHPYKLK